MPLSWCKIWVYIYQNIRHYSETDFLRHTIPPPQTEWRVIYNQYNGEKTQSQPKTPPHTLCWSWYTHFCCRTYRKTWMNFYAQALRSLTSDTMQRKQKVCLNTKSHLAVLLIYLRPQVPKTAFSASIEMPLTTSTLSERKSKYNFPAGSIYWIKFTMLH